MSKPGSGRDKRILVRLISEEGFRVGAYDYEAWALCFYLVTVLVTFTSPSTEGHPDQNK